MAKEYGKVQDIYISAEDTMSCEDPEYDGCDGGNAYNAFTMFIKKGAVSGGNHTKNPTPADGCKPYPFSPDLAGEQPQSPDCVLTCKNKKYTKAYDEDKYYMLDHIRLSGKSPDRIERMQRELMTNGPMHVTITIYDDIMLYGKGIYAHVTGEPHGGHAVRLIGWGESKDENNVTAPYWIIANSWGPRWGEDGCFRIARGQDECGVETTNINFGSVALPPPPE